MSYGLFETEPRIINTRGGGASKIAPVYEVLRMSDIICQYCLNINFCNSVLRLFKKVTAHSPVCIVFFCNHLQKCPYVIEDVIVHRGHIDK